MGVGMRVKCSRCRGTGDMGVMSPSRCRVCRGSGCLELDGQQTALYEWIEGYLDPDTDEEWLEDQLRRLLEIRDEILGKKD
jgi:hypothetical protein